MGIFGVSACLAGGFMSILGMLVTSESGAASAAPLKTVFDPLTQQLGRAKGVQHTVNANTENMRKAVDITASETAETPKMPMETPYQPASADLECTIVDDKQSLGDRA